jgi:hypothetical protein
MVGSASKLVACQRVGGAQLAQEHRLGLLEFRLLVQRRSDPGVIYGDDL